MANEQARMHTCGADVDFGALNLHFELTYNSRVLVFFSCSSGPVPIRVHRWLVRISARSCRNGKPDFHLAMPGRDAERVYQHFLNTLRSEYNVDKVRSQAFPDATFILGL